VNASIHANVFAVVLSESGISPTPLAIKKIGITELIVSIENYRNERVNTGIAPRIFISGTAGLGYL
jgi:hypothetical protein